LTVGRIIVEAVSDTSTGLGGQRGHGAAHASRIEPAGGWCAKRRGQGSGHLKAIIYAALGMSGQTGAYPPDSV
jgi:hypothetical protein